MVAKVAIDELRAAHDGLLRKKASAILRIPILVPANRLLEVEDSATLVRDYFGDQNSGLDVHNVSKLFVDGLDEVEADSRQTVVDRSSQFARELDCSLVITTRKIDLLDSHLEDFAKLEVLPLEYGQALTLLKRLLPQDTTLLDSITGGLENLSLDYPLSPLTLRMLASLVEEAKEIPASAAELYERFFDSVLGRSDRERGIEALFDYQVKGRRRGALAFSEFFSKSRIAIDLEEFNQFLEAYGSEHIPGWDVTLRAKVLAEVERSSVLRVTASEVQFRHKTFLDYLSAQYIRDFRDDIPEWIDQVTEVHFSNIWSDVAFFFVGLLRRIPERILHSSTMTIRAIGFRSRFVGPKLGGYFRLAGRQPRRSSLLAYSVARTTFLEYAMSFWQSWNGPAQNYPSSLETIWSTGSRVLVRERHAGCGATRHSGQNG